MKVKVADLYNTILPGLYWQTLDIVNSNGYVIDTILKHPVKKLYFNVSGHLGKSYRNYQGYSIDITHRYFDFHYNKEYDFDSSTGLITLDDVVAINLK